MIVESKRGLFLCDSAQNFVFFVRFRAEFRRRTHVSRNVPAPIDYDDRRPSVVMLFVNAKNVAISDDHAQDIFSESKVSNRDSLLLLVITHLSDKDKRAYSTIYSK